MKQTASHYVVRVTNMPPTELECKCGMRAEGPDCLTRMGTHIREGERRVTGTEPPTDSLVATCRVCGKRWDIDRDPTACTCTDPADDDWTLDVE